MQPLCSTIVHLESVQLWTIAEGLNFNPFISVSSAAAASLSCAIIETSKAIRKPLCDLMPSDFYLFYLVFKDKCQKLSAKND